MAQFLMQRLRDVGKIALREKPSPMVENLFDGIPAALSDELSTTLLRAAGFRVERIVSRGNASPPGFWYDQDEDEWVVVLSGAARLCLDEGDGETKTIELRPGDYLYLPAHRKHRVEWTTPEESTVWLAIHFSADA